MPDVGVLFSLPTESVAVRAVVGSLTALLLVSLLLRVLRVPKVRYSAVLTPVVALIGAIVASWSELLWPVLMTSTEGEGALPMLVRGEYVGFAPVAWPLLVVWAVYGSWRVGRRLLAHRQMVLVAAAGGVPREARLTRLVNAASARLRIPAPRTVVVDGCPGGALVVGIRRPSIVVDAQLIAALDDEELEGLIAHELAHVRRRDNLLALIVGVVRDLCFFVPGGRWVTRRLCAEREFAADTIAVEVTGRPGALASGLLKVVDARRPTAACAAFAAPAATALVTRVERLCGEEAARSGLPRTALESAGVAAVATISIALAFQLPAAIAGASGERDALAVLWAWSTPTVEPTEAEPAAFSAFRRVDAYEPATMPGSAEVASDGSEFNPSYLRGLREPGQATEEELLRQAREARVEEELMRAWRATPVVAGDDGVGVYWLHRRH